MRLSFVCQLCMTAVWNKVYSHKDLLWYTKTIQRNIDTYHVLLDIEEIYPMYGEIYFLFFYLGCKTFLKFKIWF